MKGTVVFDFDYTLADTTGFKVAMSESVDKAVSRMPEFIFDGADSVLRRLRADGWKLALLTLGEPIWQERKVLSSGLLEYFDYLVYTPDSKTERVQEFSAWPSPLIFVNDNGEEIDAMLDVLPGCLMLAVPGPKATPKKPEVKFCGNLEEVYGIISSSYHQTICSE